MLIREFLNRGGRKQIRRSAQSEGSSLVRFTERGWQFCQAANRVRLELEAEYEQALGKDAMRNLRGLLEKLLEHST